jgi:hypothetical protein
MKNLLVFALVAPLVAGLAPPNDAPTCANSSRSDDLTIVIRQNAGCCKARHRGLVGWLTRTISMTRLRSVGVGNLGSHDTVQGAVS